MTPPLIPPEQMEEFIQLYGHETSHDVIEQRFGLTWTQIKGFASRHGIPRHCQRPGSMRRIFQTQEEIDHFCRVVQSCECSRDVIDVFPHLNPRQVRNQMWKVGVSFKKSPKIKTTKFGNESMKLVLHSLEHMLREITRHRHNDTDTTQQ